MSMHYQSLGVDPWNVPQALLPGLDTLSTSKGLSQRAAHRAEVRQALEARQAAASPSARRGRLWRRVPVTATKTA